MSRKRDPKDAEIGKRLRGFRLKSGLTQSQLGELLGVTFQQIQKYETGMNSISAGRLQRIANAVDVPISMFYFADSAKEDAKKRKSIPEFYFDFGYSDDAKRLVRAYLKIANKKIRHRIVQLAQSLAADGAS